MKDITVEVIFPENIRGKNLKVEIEEKRLYVYNKLTNKEVINGELFDRINYSDSHWTISDGRVLNFVLEKAEENVWKTVIIGDEEIDPKTVDNSKKLEEFDEET